MHFYYRHNILVSWTKDICLSLVGHTQKWYMYMKSRAYLYSWGYISDRSALILQIIQAFAKTDLSPFFQGFFMRFFRQIWSHFLWSHFTCMKLKQQEYTCYKVRNFGKFRKHNYIFYVYLGGKNSSGHVLLTFYWRQFTLILYVHDLHNLHYLILEWNKM